MLAADGPVDAATIEAAQSLVKTSMVPATSEDIIGWIEDLLPNTKHPAHDDADLRAIAKMFVWTLTQYPRDVVFAAMFRSGWVWFPALEEVKKAADKLVERRKVLVWLLERGAVDTPQRERELPSPTARADILKKGGFADLADQTFACPEVNSKPQPENSRRDAGHIGTLMKDTLARAVAQTDVEDQ